MVVTTVKPDKKFSQHGMIHRLAAIILNKVALGNIGLVILIMHQDVIPGLVFWRATPRNLIVPGITSHKDRIYVHDHTAVVEQAVTDALADGESGLFLFHTTTPCPGKPGCIIYDTQACDKFAPVCGTRIIAGHPP